MSDYKRNYPRSGNKTVRGFFFDATALDLSLEATGLAAHIMAFDANEIDEEYLGRMFPGRDLAPLIKEIAAIGLINIVDTAAAPPSPSVEVEEDVRLRKCGTIYLVEGGGRFKVGISAQSAKARLRGLQTGSPVPLRLVHSTFVNDYAEAERLAHGLLARFRLHGEWFECTEERALSVLNTVIEAVGQK